MLSNANRFFYKFQLHIQIDRPFNFKQHDNNLGDFFLLARLSSSLIDSMKSAKHPVCMKPLSMKTLRWMLVALSTVFWVEYDDDAQTPLTNMFFFRTRDFSARLANFNPLLINVESNMVSLKLYEWHEIMSLMMEMRIFHKLWNFNNVKMAILQSLDLSILGNAADVCMCGNSH